MSRVLIVEDEAHLAKGLQFNLEAEGLAVEVTGDGESALRLLLGGSPAASPERRRENQRSGQARRGDFDAVVLDVMLPGKDGFDSRLGIAGGEEFCSGADAHRAGTAGRCAEGICLRRRRLSS